MDDKPTKLLYKASRVAELLDLSRSQVYNMIADGTLRSVKIRNSIRVPADAVEALARGATV